MQIELATYGGYQLICINGLWECVDLDLASFKDVMELCKAIDQFKREYESFLDEYYFEESSQVFDETADKVS